EAAVLDRDRGAGKPLRHVRERDRLAVPLGRDGTEERAVLREHERVLADVDRPQGGEAAAPRQGRAAAARGGSHPPEPHHREGPEDPPGPPAPLAPRRALALPVSLGEEMPQLVGLPAARHDAPSSRSANSIRRSLATRSVCWARGTQRRTETVAVSGLRSVTSTSSPSRPSDSSVFRNPGPTGT